MPWLISIRKGSHRTREFGLILGFGYTVTLPVLNRLNLEEIFLFLYMVGLCNY